MSYFEAVNKETLKNAWTRFEEEGILIVAKSRYVQPIGTFSGTLRLPGGEVAVADLVGVTEDHAARW